MNEPQVNDCGCCTGIDTETPVLIANVPGLPTIRYRTGDYPKFRESLLAKLSSSEYPVPANLSTREEEDFTIALCEAGATMLDVLTFYQERIANENYLRTATEDTSLLELAKLIGYTPLPGVAASTYLAFTLQESPGAPTQAAEPVTIPVATRVQSIPGSGEQAQTFETVEAINARVEWNAIPVQTTIPWIPKRDDTDLWLEGLANQIQVSDVLLIVGVERDKNDSGSEQWDIRLLKEVELDRDNNRTRVAWDKPLGDNAPLTNPAQSEVKVYVFRQRAALFGYNAQNPKLLNTVSTNTKTTVVTSGKKTTTTETTVKNDSPQLLDLLDANHNWKEYYIKNNEIDLEAAYSKIVQNSWFALVNNQVGTPSNSGLQGYIELYKASQVAFPSRTEYGISGKITRLIPDTTENLNKFKFELQNTLVLAQSEQLTTTERPLFAPLYGNQVSLASLHLELV
uniref:hypothetical protein n=1 Tax=Crenothrix polyspora TaxID=360316 RepID=UPI001C4F14F1